MSLASVAPSVWHERGRATARGATAPGPALTDAELARAAQKTLALAQQDKSAWTRADVIKHLGRVLPRAGMNPAAAAVLLEDLADRALASDFEPATCLEAPELADIPPSLRRADGRSVYQRHGGTRYATRAQLAMEQRMLTQARADTALRLARDQAAHALGADLTQLENALTCAAPSTHEQLTQSGLREDQAAAALAALTDGRLVSVINAPAGSGKTRVLAEAARISAEAGLGPVIGIIPSQSARNTLAAGVPHSYNAAQFLGHLPGRRGARGPIPIGPGTLLVVDEASMLSGPDLADLIAYARARGAKIILAGDLSQLQAVENGGGMSLLAARLGYARLAEPVRLRHPWEQHASLRLRHGLHPLKSATCRRPISGIVNRDHKIRGRASRHVCLRRSWRVPLSPVASPLRPVLVLHILVAASRKHANPWLPGLLSSEFLDAAMGRCGLAGPPREWSVSSDG